MIPKIYRRVLGVGVIGRGLVYQKSENREGPNIARPLSSVRSRATHRAVSCTASTRVQRDSRANRRGEDLPASCCRSDPHPRSSPREDLHRFPTAVRPDGSLGSSATAWRRTMRHQTPKCRAGEPGFLTYRVVIASRGPGSGPPGCITNFGEERLFWRWGLSPVSRSEHHLEG